MRFHQKGVKNVVSSSGTALSKDQINIIRRLSKNITVIYDSDKAGINATERSVDMILEQGMNINIVLLPENEDPDSFAKNKNESEILNFLNENSVDFIEFKANILNKTLKNTPSEKAKVINDLIISISKIPDRIKQEIYIRHCSEIMNISEQTLFNVLSQISGIKIQTKKFQSPVFNVSPQQTTVDQVYELEKKIIEILILYGDKKVVFDEIKISKSEEGDVVYKNVKIESQVFEKVFLDLQSDEIEFANPEFKELYRLIIKNFQSSNFDISSILNSVDGELSNLVTTIMMKEDIYQLHKWKSKNVYVKDKNKSISQLVTETILTLRTLLINRKVNELSKSNNDSENLDQNLLEEIVNYYQLKNFLSKKLNRVI